MRRRGRSPTTRLGTNQSHQQSFPDFMDSGDQDAFVASLEAEFLNQSKKFQAAFTAVGVFAMIVSLIFPLLCYDECSIQLVSCWTHSAAACIMHTLSILLIRTQEKARVFASNESTLVIFCFLINGALFVLWAFGFFNDDAEHFHLGLVIGNTVTLAGAALLRWDAHSTHVALDDLHGSKYEHKSL